MDVFGYGLLALLFLTAIWIAKRCDRIKRENALKEAKAGHVPDIATVKRVVAAYGGNQVFSRSARKQL